MEQQKTTIADVIRKRPGRKPQRPVIETELATSNPEVVVTTPDYKALYEKASAENKVLTNKLAEMEKLCKSFAEKEATSGATLQKATMEYDARTKYILDCVKHAYVSIQLAVADKGGKQ